MVHGSRPHESDREAYAPQEDDVDVVCRLCDFLSATGKQTNSARVSIFTDDLKILAPSDMVSIERSSTNVDTHAAAWITAAFLFPLIWGLLRS